MPMDSPQARRIAAVLARRPGGPANAAQVADATVAVWREVDAALNSVIGLRGVAALYRRSLFLQRCDYPWLASAVSGPDTAMDLAALKAALAQQDSAVAAAAGGATLQTFHELLISLVGPSLTERLLRSVWTTFSSGSPAQDTPT